MKECGECRSCCRGSLLVEVHGQKVAPGNPCRFISAAGCEIYNDDPLPRPMGCKTFICLWKQHESLGPELRPDRCGFVISRPGSAREIDVITTRVNYDRHAARFTKRWAAEKELTIHTRFALSDPPGM